MNMKYWLTAADSLEGVMFVWQVKTSTGECPDEKDVQIIDLQTQILNLQAERDSLISKVSDLELQLGHDGPPADEQEEQVDCVGLTDAAVKKRLMRLVGKPGTFGCIVTLCL